MSGRRRAVLLQGQRVIRVIHVSEGGAVARLVRCVIRRFIRHFVWHFIEHVFWRFVLVGLNEVWITVVVYHRLSPSAKRAAVASPSER
jgi:hypothetical protein